MGEIFIMNKNITDYINSKTNKLKIESEITPGGSRLLYV